MKYTLDTNTCIRYINGRSPLVRQKLPTIPASEIVICSIVRAELFYGAAKSQTPEVSLKKQLGFLRPYTNVDFDEKAAAIYGSMRKKLEAQGIPIGSHDMLIAAIALAHDLIVVTHNIKHFSRVEGLKVEDWEV